MNIINSGMKHFHDTLRNYAEQTISYFYETETPITERVLNFTTNFFHKIANVFNERLLPNPFWQSLNDWANEEAPGEDRETAKKIIWDVYRNRSDALNLPNMRLTSLPDCISQLTNVTSLRLNGNRLLELPNDIGNLKNLSIVNLSGNQLSSLPENFRELENLLWINLTQNYFTELPGCIRELPMLAWMLLAENPINSTHPSVQNLPPTCLIYFDTSVFSDQMHQVAQEISSTRNPLNLSRAFLEELGHSEEVSDFEETYSSEDIDGWEEIDDLEQPNHYPCERLLGRLSRLSTIPKRTN